MSVKKYRAARGDTKNSIAATARVYTPSAEKTIHRIFRERFIDLHASYSKSGFNPIKI
jgi:hypothetical protein